MNETISLSVYWFFGPSSHSSIGTILVCACFLKLKPLVIENLWQFNLMSIKTRWFSRFMSDLYYKSKSKYNKIRNTRALFFHVFMHWFQLLSLEKVPSCIPPWSPLYPLLVPQDISSMKPFLILLRLSHVFLFLGISLSKHSSHVL